MPQKKKTKTNFINFVPTTRFSPAFNNLTNDLSLQTLQQHQNTTTQPFTDLLINEMANHIEYEARYPGYMDPLNETTRYPVNIYSSIIILYEDNKLEVFFYR